ncbi:MAG: polyprenyl synthetase family protein [Chloroflexi bacterium]|nr:polyprenyl synthetase family protein [Chloroflexota bacterium]
MLLGIASSALDATQDGHDDLLNAYTSSLNTDHGAKQAYLTNDFVTSPGRSRFTQPHPDAQSDRQRKAAVVGNASIALIGLAWQALHKYGPEFGIEAETVVKLGELIAQNMVRVCEAQHQDLTAGQTPRLSLEEYERLITGKAGAIAATACEAAAIVARADHHRIQWRTIGLEREIAKQLCDDYNDLEDDIVSGRQVSHPILYALTVCDDDQRIQIEDLLDRARSASSEAASALRELITLARELGAEYYWLASLVAHRERALAALEELHLPVEAERWVREWILRVAPVLPVAH